MNIVTSSTAQTSHRPGATCPASATATSAQAASGQRLHRERDFGVGYGSSSGYASGRRYTQAWGNERFRCG